MFEGGGKQQIIRTSMTSVNAVVLYVFYIQLLSIPPILCCVDDDEVVELLKNFKPQKTGKYWLHWLNN